MIIPGHTGMESFYLITPIALITIAVAIKLLLWAINNGQYDDLDREASRILFDEDLPSPRKDAPSSSSDGPAKSAANGMCSEQTTP